MNECHDEYAWSSHQSTQKTLFKFPYFIPSRQSKHWPPDPTIQKHFPREGYPRNQKRAKRNNPVAKGGKKEEEILEPQRTLLTRIHGCGDGERRDPGRDRVGRRRRWGRRGAGPCPRRRLGVAVLPPGIRSPWRYRPPRGCRRPPPWPSTRPVSPTPNQAPYSVFPQ